MKTGISYHMILPGRVLCINSFNRIVHESAYFLCSLKISSCSFGNTASSRSLPTNAEASYHNFCNQNDFFSILTHFILMGCSRLNASIFQQKKRTLLCIFGYFEKCNSVVLSRIRPFPSKKTLKFFEWKFFSLLF